MAANATHAMIESDSFLLVPILCLEIEEGSMIRIQSNKIANMLTFSSQNVVNDYGCMCVCMCLVSMSFLFLSAFLWASRE